MKEYDEDTIEVGDVVKYYVKATEYNDGMVRYGLVDAFKHGEVVVRTADIIYDRDTGLYVAVKHGPYSKYVKVIRPLHEVTKLPIEEMI